MMKKILFAVLCAVIGVMAQAQIFVGGTLGVATEKSSGTERITTFTIKPTVGYNLTDNLAVGLEIGYGYADYSDISYNEFNIGSFVRYYFAEVGDFRFFGEGAAYFASAKVSEADAVNGWGLAVRPGLAFNLNSQWQLLGKLNFFEYEHFKGGNATSFGINFTGIELGIAYTF